MSIATDQKVEGLLQRMSRMEQRMTELESEIETLKSLPAIMTDAPRGTNSNARPQKR